MRHLISFSPDPRENMSKQHSKSIQPVSPVTAMHNLGYIRGWPDDVFEMRLRLRKPNNSKVKTLRSWREGSMAKKFRRTFHRQ